MSSCLWIPWVLDLEALLHESLHRVTPRSLYVLQQFCTPSQVELYAVGEGRGGVQ